MLFYAGVMWTNWRYRRYVVENVRQYFMPKLSGNGMKKGWGWPWIRRRQEKLRVMETESLWDKK